MKKMKTSKYYKKNKLSYYIGITKKFQYIGFIISTDNPIHYCEYFLIEFRLLWLRCWIAYDFDLKK